MNLLRFLGCFKVFLSEMSRQMGFYIKKNLNSNFLISRGNRKLAQSSTTTNDMSPIKKN